METNENRLRKRTNLRRKGETALILPEIQWLHASVVAGKPKAGSAGFQPRECVHAVKVAEKLGSAEREPPKQSLRVGAPVEGHPGRFQTTAMHLVVVDLTVEHERSTAELGHGLCAGWAEIDDG